jgi:hypothetical protein
MLYSLGGVLSKLTALVVNVGLLTRCDSFHVLCSTLLSFFLDWWCSIDVTIFLVLVRLHSTPPYPSCALTHEAHGNEMTIEIENG